jgi:GNAT superfamily N-acetyltransferase
MTDFLLRERPALTDVDLNTLFAAATPGHAPRAFGPVLARSRTWIAAYLGDELVGFVNLAWDGGVHTFLLDPTVHPDCRRLGLGLELVRAAIAAAAGGGVQWLHVDYEEHLAGFYAAAGFRPTPAGLIRLPAANPSRERLSVSAARSE